MPDLMIVRDGILQPAPPQHQRLSRGLGRSKAVPTKKPFHNTCRSFRTCGTIRSRR